MRAEDLGRLIRASGEQAGTFSGAQAVELGVSRRRLVEAERSGVPRRLHPSVFFIGGGEVPRRARIHGVLLAVGHDAVPSHEAAFYLHGVDRVPFVAAVTTGPTGECGPSGCSTT